MDERRYTVYKHTSPNGKVYIGITGRNPRKRWGRGYAHNAHFQSAIREYGWENIQHEIIAEEMLAEEAKQTEQLYIAFFNSMNPKCGYNLTAGGDGLQGHVCTEEERERRKERAIGNHWAAGHKMPEWQHALNYGNKYAAGCVRSPETRAKMSASRKDKHKVVQISIVSGEKIACYDSVKAAGAAVDGWHQNIAACCTGRQKTAYGYVWRYAE